MLNLPDFQSGRLREVQSSPAEVRVKGVLVTAVVCLSTGIGVLFAFCHGNTGVQFAYPFSAASVHVDITTTGVPAIAGLILTIGGVMLLMVATIIALIGLFSRDGEMGPIKRRDSAFEE